MTSAVPIIFQLLALIIRVFSKRNVFITFFDVYVFGMSFYITSCTKKSC